MPVVEAVGVATGRLADDGRALDDVLITKHLEFSLPYRALFMRASMVDLWPSLLDGQAELLVRAHLAGFFWGDCSLSNGLFRRDAGRLAAWLVDAETGELHGSCPTASVSMTSRSRRSTWRESCSTSPRPDRDGAAAPRDRPMTSVRPGRDRRPLRRRYDCTVGRAHRRRGLRHRRAVADRRADPATQRPRVRRRRDGVHPRTRGHRLRLIHQRCRARPPSPPPHWRSPASTCRRTRPAGS